MALPQLFWQALSDGLAKTAEEGAPEIWQPQDHHHKDCQFYKTGVCSELENCGTPGPQRYLVEVYRDIFEVGLGGARGGGKTDGSLGDYLAHRRQAAAQGGKARGMFIRQVAKDLEDVIERSHEVFPQTGGVWNGSSRTWRWITGDFLRFRHLRTTADASHYQGHGYTWLGFEELTQWPDDLPFRKMFAAMRSGSGVQSRLVTTFNPGGPGHNWVKARYVDPARGGHVKLTDKTTGLPRIFVPARLEDNPRLVQKDPGYEQRLLGSGPADLVKAWRWGLWDIVAGGFFDDLFTEERVGRVIIPPFAIPDTWSFRRSFDWGYSAPAALGLFAISDGVQPAKPPKGAYFPRGSYVMFGEWYTVAKDEHGDLRPNVGQKLTNIALGRGIAKKSGQRRWNGCVADPSIFAEDGGDSIYKQMRKGAKEASHTLILSPADNSRHAGWQQLRDFLKEAGQERAERPGLWLFENCRHTIRTIPTLPRDDDDKDDIDTDAEDHAADMVRYSLMSRRRKVSSRGRGHLLMRRGRAK